MKNNIIRIAATLFVSQLVIGTSFANVFDDDLMKLQQEQFKLQRQLQQQQFRLQQQQLKLDRQLMEQQSRTQRQLMDQQFKMQRQQWKLESYNRNLNVNSSSSTWAIGSPAFDSMNNIRSQIRIQDYNINPVTNISNRNLIKLHDQQFRIQQQLMRQTFKDQQQLSKIVDNSSKYVTQSLLRRYDQLVPDPSREWNSLKLQSDLLRGTGLYLSTVMLAVSPYSWLDGASTLVGWAREMGPQPAPATLQSTSNILGISSVGRNILRGNNVNAGVGIASLVFSDAGHEILRTRLGPSKTLSDTFHVNSVEISSMGRRIETSGVISIQKTIRYEPDSIPNWGLPDPLKATYSYERRWSLTT
ncbi:MAG: hypothetical protein JSV32_06650, partial [Dehalococcoidia bacterium]